MFGFRFSDHPPTLHKLRTELNVTRFRLCVFCGSFLWRLILPAGKTTPSFVFFFFLPHTHTHDSRFVILSVLIPEAAAAARRAIVFPFLSFIPYTQTLFTRYVSICFNLCRYAPRRLHSRQPTPHSVVCIYIYPSYHTHTHMGHSLSIRFGRHRFSPKLLLLPSFPDHTYWYVCVCSLSYHTHTNTYYSPCMYRSILAPADTLPGGYTPGSSHLTQLCVCVFIPHTIHTQTQILHYFISHLLLTSADSFRGGLHSWQPGKWPLLYFIFPHSTHTDSVLLWGGVSRGYTYHHPHAHGL